MKETLKMFALCLVGATVIILFTTRPNDPEAGIMGIIQGEQLKMVLAEGFYYGAIALGLWSIMNRRKRNQKKKEAEAKEAAAREADNPVEPLEPVE